MVYSRWGVLSGLEGRRGVACGIRIGKYGVLCDCQFQTGPRSCGSRTHNLWCWFEAYNRTKARFSADHLRCEYHTTPPDTAIGTIRLKTTQPSSQQQSTRRRLESPVIRLESPIIPADLPHSTWGHVPKSRSIDAASRLTARAAPPAQARGRRWPVVPHQGPSDRWRGA